MKIFNIIRGIWIVINMIVAFIVLAPIDILLSITLQKRRPWFLTWLWSKWVFSLSGIHYELDGYENLTPGESYVFMSNHTHEADIALLYMALKRDIVFVIKEEFKKVTNFLQNILEINFTDQQIESAINSSSFDKLQAMEEIHGFTESIEKKKTGEKNKFFYLGPKNDWTKILDKKIADEISSKFEPEMKELGYL